MTVKIGFGLVTAQLPPWAEHTVAEEYADTLAMTRTAERLGFDSIWVSEHHVAEDGYLPSALPLLAAMGAVTDTLTLGTAIVLSPFHNPLRFAEDAAVVDAISGGGRLVLGLGTGWRRREFETFELSTRDRAPGMVRLVDVCRRAWGSPVDGDEASAATPKPVQPIPLLLGGTVPAAIDRAGRIADGYIGSPQNDIDAFRAAVGRFDAAALAAGRDPATLKLALHVNAWISADGQIPAAVTRAMWHQIGTYMRWHAEDDGAPVGGEPPALDLDRLRTRTVFGTPDDVVEQLTPWIEEFADRELHFIFRLHYPGMRLADAEPAMNVFAEAAAPRLRAVAPRTAGVRPRDAVGRR
jgi:alkanesulfonate monooxygenase SsuD/methylene tetrahydromethanopterin reductase-like flavin-dependent oxidoreductase (luciferase family)